VTDRQIPGTAVTCNSLHLIQSMWPDKIHIGFKSKSLETNYTTDRPARHFREDNKSIISLDNIAENTKGKQSSKWLCTD